MFAARKECSLDFELMATRNVLLQLGTRDFVQTCTINMAAQCACMRARNIVREADVSKES